jgi:hypothetical protein
VANRSESAGIAVEAMITSAAEPSDNTTLSPETRSVVTM